MICALVCYYGNTKLILYKSKIKYLSVLIVYRHNYIFLSVNDSFINANNINF